MASGLQPSVTDVNNTVGSACRDLKLALERLHDLRSWYLALGAGGLTQVPYSLSAADDANVASALSDAEQLYQLYLGAQTLSVAKDFTTFLKREWGFGF